MMPPPPAWPVLSGPLPPLADSYNSRYETGPDLRNTLNPGDMIVLGPAEDLPIAGWLAGGTGKTQLAAGYARALLAGREIDLLVWVPASSRDGIITSYAQALADISAVAPAEEPEPAAGEFLAWLTRGGKRWLVVLDDLIDPADADGLWPRGDGRVLVTTERDAPLRAQGRRIVPVPEFTKREAVSYLATRLSGDPYQSTGALDLATDLDCLPLSLSQAAAYMLDAGLDCRDYRRAYVERRQRLPSGSAKDPSAALDAIWTLALDRAEKLPPAGMAWPALLLTSMLGPGGIPGAVFTSEAACAYVTGRYGASPEDKTSVRTALSNLARLGLVTIDASDMTRTVRMHGLLQAAVRRTLAQPEVDRAAIVAADAIYQAWPVGGRSGLDQVLRDCAASIRRIAGRSLWDPDSHPVLLRAGQSLEHARLAGPAIGYWQELAGTSRRTLGAGHPGTLRFVDQLAKACEAAGRADHAVSLREQLLADREQAFGPVHPETVAARTALAASYLLAGRTRESLGLYQRTLTDRERAVGPDHPETLTARGNLAFGFVSAGRINDAIPIYKRLLADRLRTAGPDAPEALIARANLATAYALAKVPREAVPLFEQVLAERERVQGPEHEDALTARADLAAAYQASRRHPDAIRLYERTLADRERLLGLARADTLASYESLAQAYQSGGRQKDALALLQRAVAGYEQALGADHPLAESARALRQAYLAGRYDRALLIRPPTP